MPAGCLKCLDGKMNSNNNISPDNDLIGAFAFGIKVYGKENPITIVQAKARNIPKELIIMKMKAQLRQYERDYFGDFDNSVQGTELKGE